MENLEVVENRQILAVDVDGVCNDLINHILKKNNYCQYQKAIRNYNIMSCYEMPIGVRQDIIATMECGQTYDNVEPFDIGVLNMLPENIDIVFYSLSLNLTCEKHKRKWIEDYLVPQIKRKVAIEITIGHKPIIKCDYLIEDCLENIASYESTKTKCFLVDRQYNKTNVEDNFVRVKGIDGAIKKILEEV